MLKLRIVQAKFGDCLIVEYGSEKKPKYMLIDGGPGGVYTDFLRGELVAIKKRGGSIELMVLSHIDGDHIVGLLEFLEELKENSADEVEGLIEVKDLWVNTFSQTVSRGNNIKQALMSMLKNVNNLSSTIPSGDLAVQSILQGDTLRRNAILLNIPINRIVDNEIITYDSLSSPFPLDNLTITIIGPNQENLDKLRKEWTEWIKKNEAKVLTTDRELLAQMDRSVPNLSSIMFLMECEGKRILFTGDGRGDFILEGLEKAGLLDKKGKIQVDIFKVPHHGSVRNTTEDFFDKIIADLYIISADGRHHNPDFDTLSWIVSAAHKQGRKIKLLCTNETDSSKKLLKDMKPTAFGYELEYLPKGDTSVVLTLV
jgi:beta-lactamase superfamily II metal-dependent hydrolase